MSSSESNGPDFEKQNKILQNLRPSNVLTLLYEYLKFFHIFMLHYFCVKWLAC